MTPRGFPHWTGSCQKSCAKVSELIRAQKNGNAKPHSVKSWPGFGRIPFLPSRINGGFMMKHQLRFWHRWLGILSTLALCWLAITGLLLNHSHDFGIDRKKIHNSFVNQYYGVPESQQEVIAYKLEGDI